MTCCRAYEVSAATALSKTRLPSVSALYTSSSSAPWVIFLIEWVSWWTPLDAKVAYAAAISMGFTLAVPSTFDGFGVRPIEQPPVSPDFISSSVQKKSGETGGCSIGLTPNRSEEHTSELQSRFDLVCR